MEDDPEVFLLEADERMEKTVDLLRGEMMQVRTGRAHPGILDGVKVNYYGTPTPLNKLATVSVPEARLLTVQPFDPNSSEAIIAAIRDGGMGLNPSSQDGHIIRVPIPELSEERRRDYVRLVKKLGEDARIAIRNIRRETNDRIRKLEHIGEDEVKRQLEEVQKLTDRQVSVLDAMIVQKEKDLETL